MPVKIPVEVSARHVHLSQKDLETLFGKGYCLTRKKALS
ncbi:propanediol utilization protein, partial [Patescibacteria group bacterium]|nr:propanediol utilization protein [Patescibacteria group bacterium]